MAQFTRSVFGLFLFFSWIASADHKPPELHWNTKHETARPDPYLESSWHLYRIRAVEAWKTSEGNPETTIAFIDSGIEYNHPELQPNLRKKTIEWPSNGIDDDANGFIDDVIGWDFVKNSFLPFDRSKHGTFLSGLAAAVKDNGIGSSGVCPRCTLLTCRFLNWEGLGDTEDAIEGIYYAIRERVSVINVSFSGEGYDKALFRALDKARLNDIVVVAAASNDGVNVEKESIYPAKFHLPNLITVAASDKRDRLWENSNWGPKSVHLAVPAVDVLGPYEGKWETGTGTSDAAAIMSGAVGLLRSVAPSLTAEQVVDIFETTVRVVPSMKKKTRSEGILDLAAAINCATKNQLSCLQSIPDLDSDEKVLSERKFDGSARQGKIEQSPETWPQSHGEDFFQF